MPARATDTLHTAGNGIAGSCAVHHRRPVVEVAAFFQREAVGAIIVIVRICGTCAGAFGDGRAVSIVRGAEVLFHPALVTDLHGVVLVAVKVLHLRGTVQTIIHIVHHTLQTVQLLLQPCNVGDFRRVNQVIVIAGMGHRGEGVKVRTPTVIGQQVVASGTRVVHEQTAVASLDNSGGQRSILVVYRLRTLVVDIQGGTGRHIVGEG